MIREFAKDSFKWSTKFYLSSIALVSVTFLAGKNFLGLNLTYSILLGIAAFLISAFIRFILLLLLELERVSKLSQEQGEALDLIATSSNERRKSNKLNSIYGEAIILLQDAFAKVNYLKIKDSNDVNEHMTIIASICETLKSFFDSRSQAISSVCIKVIKDEIDPKDIDNTTCIVTLCRDSRSTNARTSVEIASHKLFENTCFHSIFSNLSKPYKNYYFNNDLPATKDYENSSCQVYGQLPDPSLSPEMRRQKWPLPYQAEIVVPICPIIVEGDDIKSKFMGFLCVDINQHESFHTKYDIPLLKGVADGIYPLIKKIKSFQSNEHKGN